ncbi:MAG: hypothetical protein WC326_11635 [Candidatus Delongbacteria bacterium]
MNRVFVAAVCVVGAARLALAEPFQLAVWDPVQLRPAAADIEGLRLSLFYGRNHDLLGLDAGLVNRLDGSGTGIQYGAANHVAGSFTGLQEAWLYSATEGSLTGIQSACLTRCGSLTGIELGVVNWAGSVQGLQLGLYNRCSGLHGLQIGLLNHDASDSRLPILPLLRWGR